MKNRNKHILLTLLFVFIVGVSSAYENQTIQIDSLKTAVKTETNAEKIVDIYIDLSDLYDYINPDSSLAYGQKALELAQKINPYALKIHRFKISNEIRWNKKVEVNYEYRLTILD
nr:hypothetical protein [uncultured Draconibacterium sp.]